VYARETVDSDGNKQVINLEVSGKLWRDALVMQDKESKSLCTQHDGRALTGPASEEQLKMEPLPSERLNWSEASVRYPQAKVLKKRTSLLGSGKKDIYAEYRESKDADSVFGTGGGGELPPKEVILGVELDGQAIAVRFEALPKKGSVPVELAGQQLALSRKDATDAQGQVVDSRRMFWFAWKRAHPATELREL
jgi:hypothetical protein